MQKEFDRSHHESFLKFANTNYRFVQLMLIIYHRCSIFDSKQQTIRATTSTPISWTMESYIAQQHKVILTYKKSNENTIPTTKETSHWRDRIRKYLVTFIFVTANYSIKKNSLVWTVADDCFVFMVPIAFHLIHKSDLWHFGMIKLHNYLLRYELKFALVFQSTKGKVWVSF